MNSFIQIGGQGAPWFKEFSRYYADPKMKRFYDTVIETIESELPQLEKFQELYTDLQLRKWLEKSQELPGGGYLSRTLVSMPMIQAAQLAHLEYILVNGVSMKSLLNRSAGVIGHSQGLVTATLLAQGLEGDEYYKGVENYTRYLLHLSYQSQLPLPDVYPTEEECVASRALGSKDPEPMAAVLGGEHSDAEDLLRNFNQSLPENKQVCVSLYNSPSNRILSGARASLIKFNESIKKQIKENKFDYVYIRSSCPFHSFYLQSTYETFEDVLSRIDFPYKGSDLKLPVYSFSDGRNMQSDGPLGQILCKELTVNVLRWDLALQPLALSNDVDTVIDLGPGRAISRLTSGALKARGASPYFYELSNAKPQNELLESFSG